MSTDTPQFNRQADSNFQPYSHDSFEGRQNTGRPPRPSKQTVEHTMLVEENFQIEKYSSTKTKKSYETEDKERPDSSPNAKGSVIMGLLKQMVEASNLNEHVLEKQRHLSNDEGNHPPKLRGRIQTNYIVKEEEDEEENDIEEEDLEPPKAEMLPIKIQKIVNAIKMNPNLPSEVSKLNRSRSPVTRSLSRNKIPKPSKQEAYEHTYKTSLESMKNIYASTLEQKRNKTLNKTQQQQQQSSDNFKEIYLNKENSVPNISPDLAGKIRRQRAGSPEQPNHLNVSEIPHSEKSERDNTKMKRNLFNVFAIKLDELTRIENLKKDRRQTDYFNKVLFEYAPRSTTSRKQFTKQEHPNRLEIIRAIDFLQLYHHTADLKEIQETRNNIKKIVESILKLQKDNASFAQIIKSAEISNKKLGLRKPVKEINVQENETKVVLLREIMNRMIQKVVLLVLKYLRAARILRGNLIDKSQKHFEQNICYCAMDAFRSFKELKAEKRKVLEITTERVLETRKKLIWSRWMKFTKHYNKKRGQAAQIEDFSKRCLLKRSFQALSHQKASKAMIDLEFSLAQGYSNRVRLARSFYGLHSAVEETKQPLSNKKRDIDFKNNEAQNFLRQKLAKAHKEAKHKFLIALKSKGRSHSSPTKPIKSLIHQPNAQLLHFRSLKSSVPSRLSSIMATINQNRDVQTIPEKVEPNSLALFERSLQYKRSKYGHNPSNHELITQIREHVIAMISVYKTLLKASHSGDNPRVQPLKNPPRDINEAESILTHKHKQQQLSQIFTKWKLAFLERWLEIELDLLHTMNFSRCMITNLRVFLAEKANKESENIEIAEFSYLSKIFKSWKQASHIELSTKQIVADGFFTKRFFQQWKNSLAQSRKRQLFYEESLRASQQTKLQRILVAWNEQSKKNYEVRELKKLLLQKRILRIWRKKMESRIALKKFFTLMFEAASSYTQQTPPAKNNFQLLYKIMRGWRNEVIENENTCQQKIDRLTALNHFNNHLKYKAFRGWKRIPCYSKAFPVLIKHVKNKNLKKWRILTSETHQALTFFSKEEHVRFLQKFFDRIKTYNLQEKLIRALNIKRFFLAWRASHELTQFNLPKKYYCRALMRKTFKAMKLYKKERIASFQRSLAASELERQKSARLGRMALYSLIDNVIKHKTKNLRQQRGIGFRIRFLKRRAMLGLKDYLYKQRVKKEKLRIVLNFRKAKRCLTLRIGSHFKAYPNFKNATSLLISAWRAIALKAKNEKVVASRFVSLRNRNRIRRYFVEWHEEYLKVCNKFMKTPSFKVDLEKYLPTKVEHMKKSVRAFGDEPVNRSQSDASTHDISRVSLDDSRGHMNENFARKFQVSQIRETRNFQK